MAEWENNQQSFIDFDKMLYLLNGKTLGDSI